MEPRGGRLQRRGRESGGGKGWRARHLDKTRGKCGGGEFPTADGDGCNKRRCYAWSGVVDASPSRMASAVLLVYFCFVLV